jgi:hypothetical protein
MTDCDYCGESFASDAAYDEHLKQEHFDELGPIDKRRVGGAPDDDESGIDPAPIALGGVVVAAVAIVAYVVFFAGGSAGGSGTVNGYEVAQLPTGQAYQGTHYHGAIEMTVDGQQVDFSQQQYQLQADPFHFEAGDGSQWHVHATGVTLEYAMATLDIGVTDDSVTFDGTTYTDGENADVTVTVDGTDVTPAEYVLDDGDTVRIVVQSS